MSHPAEPYVQTYDRFTPSKFGCEHFLSNGADENGGPVTMPKDRKEVPPRPTGRRDYYYD